MQRIWTFFVSTLGRKVQPSHSLACILWLSQQAVQKNHAHFVHRRRIPKSGCTPVPLYRFLWISPCTSTFYRAHLAAHSNAVSRLCMVSLGGRLVQAEGLFGVNLKAELALAVAVG